MQEVLPLRASPALSGLLLAVHGLGVGTVPTTIHRYRDAEVRTLLDMPEHIVVAAVILMGYPHGKFGAGPRKPLGEIAYFERWG